jgi:hypothetical protein
LIGFTSARCAFPVNLTPWPKFRLVRYPLRTPAIFSSRLLAWRADVVQQLTSLDQFHPF